MHCLNGLFALRRIITTCTIAGDHREILWALGGGEVVGEIGCEFGPNEALLITAVMRWPKALGVKKASPYECCTD